MAAGSNDIAIIGMSCRFPGHANDLDTFWNLLSSGTDAITTVHSRWGLTPPLTDPNGGFIDDVESFDASFFNILPKEALKMDPQHRVLLELHWEALESAGILPESIRKSNTGVYVGLSWNDYHVLLQQGENTAKDYHDLYLTTGSTHSIAAGRISFCFDLNGPAMCIDTACSSSLVAVHSGVQSLLSGESDMAFASGINIILSPITSTNFTQANMLSDRCHTFDQSAKGYARAEGGAVVVLKRLADAERDGNRILAVIKATAVNQDGHSSGITAPSKLAQTKIYSRALEKAGLGPGQVDYVEAHGTGTTLGDAVELDSIVSFYGKERLNTHATTLLGIGSVKTNIGHTETTAGLAGLLKLVLSLQHEFIPPHLHYNKPHPNFPNLAGFGVEILSKGRTWQKIAGKTRIGAVSSFGFSGTNAHAIIQEAASSGETHQSQNGTKLLILTLSAKSKSSLDNLLIRYEKYLKAMSNVNQAQGPAWSDMTFTSNVGRTHFPQHRLAIVARSKQEALRVIAAQKYQIGSRSTGANRKIQFKFTGSYSESLIALGTELHKTQSIFREIVLECSQIVRQNSNFAVDLMTFVFDKNMDTIKYGRIAVFVLEYSFGKMLLQFGVRPTSITGYGIGEYVGACLSEILTLPDALALVMAHSASEVTKFGFLRINEPAPFVNKLLGKLQLTSEIHCCEPSCSKNATTIFGEFVHITKIFNNLRHGQGKIAFILDIPNSKDAAYMAVASKIGYKKPEIEFRSGTKGLWSRSSGGNFWTSLDFKVGGLSSTKQGGELLNILDGVQSDELEWQKTESPPGVIWLNPLNEEMLLHNLAELYTMGFPLDFNNLHRGSIGSVPKLIELPKYAFDKKKFWYPSTPLKYGGTASSPSNLEPSPHEFGAAAHENESEPLKPSAPPNSDADNSASMFFSDILLDKLDSATPKCWTEQDVKYDFLFEQLCLNYVLQAFVQQKMPVHLATSSSSLNGLAKSMGIVDRHFTLFEYLISRLTRARYISQDSDTGILKVGQVPIPSLNGVQAEIQTCTAQLKALNSARDALLGLTINCGNDLAALLRGDRDPLKYLFPPTRSSEYSADRYYIESPDLQKCNQLLHQILVQALVLSSPYPDQPIRLIEIGAGTGSTTNQVLSALLKLNIPFQYTFTDISSVFFQKARKKLPGNADIVYKVLNIESDVLDLGFEPEAYDIAIGSNVFHAAKNMRQALGNVKQLLKPNGYLFLCERTQLCLALDLTFGLLGGWWRFKGNDPYRMSHALLSTPTWLHLFETSGFDSGRCIGFPETIVFGRKSGSGTNFSGRSLDRTQSFTHRSPKVEPPPIAATQGPVQDSVTEEKIAKVCVILNAIMTEVTGLETDEIDNDKEFEEIGLDSLMTIEFENSLSTAFNIELGSGITNLTSQFPTIQRLANHIAINYNVT